MPGPDNTPGGWGFTFDSRTIALLVGLLIAGAVVGALAAYFFMQ
jgi:hypothetical protein